jgi:4-nitrophenyl phosphatase
LAYLSEIRNLIVDMDGVLYLGNQPLPGVSDLFALLDQEGIQYRLATNNSSLTPERYRDKLSAMGLQMDAGKILTSSIATAMYLKQIAQPGTHIYIIGEEGLFSALSDSSQSYVFDSENPEVVVVGVDWILTYEKLKTACLAIRRGARLIATNPDTTLPTESGEIPGVGATIAALHACAGATPVVIGKPEPLMLLLAMQQMGAHPHDTASLGDRLVTDTLGGQRAGVTTILVLTGVTTRDELTGDIRPDLVYDDLPALIRAWPRTSRRRI